MALSNEYIVKRLQDKFDEAVYAFEEPYGMLTFETKADRNLDVMQFLYEDPQLSFQFLTDLTAVHYPAYQGRELAVVYHLHNLVENCRIRFKVFVPVAQPDVFSATKVFEAANWLERASGPTLVALTPVDVAGWNRREVEAASWHPAFARPTAVTSSQM